jgi:hypothetical protein
MDALDLVDIPWPAPAEEYLDFISSMSQRRSDPFARDLSQAEVYIPRRGVEELIDRHVCNIIIGPHGTGKTTLWRRTLPLINNRTVLIVPSTAIPEQACESTQGLSDHLVSLIVQTFWSELGWLYQTHSFQIEHAGDPRWEEILCWFYMNYPPVADTSSKVELARHLHGWCRDANLHDSKDQLPALVRLIQGPQQRPNVQEDRGALREWIVKHFRLEELHTVCFDLDVLHETIPGDDLRSYTRGLIEYFERKGRLPDLLAKLRQERQGVEDWESQKWQLERIRLIIDIPATMPQETQLKLIANLSALTSANLQATVLATSACDFPLCQ